MASDRPERSTEAHKHSTLAEILGQDDDKYSLSKIFSFGKRENGTEHLPKVDLVEENKETSEDAEVDRRMADLEKKYNVKFDTSTNNEYGDKVRRPTVNELRGLEAALAKSPTLSNQLRSDENKPLTFIFLKGDGFTGAQQQGDANRVIMFGYDKNMLGTVADDTTGDGSNSTEAYLLHEFAHYSEIKDGWPIDYSEMGRIKPMKWTGSTDGMAANMIEAKDGTLYRPVGEKDENGKDVWVWKRSDKYGKDLNVDEPGGKLTTQQMMDAARVRPATDYFENPRDEFAEAVMQYRMSEKMQKQLYDKNPDLYNVVKKYDQGELNRIYGTGENGASKMYRDKTGAIQPVQPGVAMNTIEEERMGESDLPRIKDAA